MPSTDSSIRTIFCGLALGALAACSFSAPTLQETRELELTVAPDTRLVLDVGAGSLSVEGEAGLDEIIVVAEVWQVAANDDYTLTLEAGTDGEARLVAEAGSSIVGNSDRIDLTIRVPSTLSLYVSDGSGSIRIERVAGDVKIDDGSGSIHLASIGGDIVIDDGSGSIVVEDAGGDVNIEDGSGSITVSDAGGVVRISDGSGSITVNGAEDFELLEDDSGSVSTKGIRSGASG
ncbi:MAG: hypothetical protein R3323_06335 [Wenzhouxiangellaceae bacterium]|nr:hypothetical protein [Wenzhouxiangellaceae bacterium]